MRRIAIIIFVAIVSCLYSGGYAQEANKVPPHKGQNHQAMMEMKKNYIKTNFEVAPAREAAFWTAYDEYTAAEMRIYKEQSQLKSQADLPHRGDTTALTDEQILQKYSINLQTKKKLLVAEEAFFEKLKKALTPQEMDAYYKCEKKFLRMAVAKQKGEKPAEGSR